MEISCCCSNLLHTQQNCRRRYIHILRLALNSRSKQGRWTHFFFFLVSMYASYILSHCKCLDSSTRCRIIMAKGNQLRWGLEEEEQIVYCIEWCYIGPLGLRLQLRRNYKYYYYCHSITSIFKKINSVLVSRCREYLCVSIERHNGEKIFLFFSSSLSTESSCSSMCSLLPC